MEEKLKRTKWNYEELEKEAQDRYRRWCAKHGHIYQCPSGAKWEDKDIFLSNIGGELARYRLNPKTGKLRKVQRAKRKSAYDVVEKAYVELKRLNPTPEEIDEFAKLKEAAKEAYGVVTYSKSYGGDWYFIRFHNTWKQKSGGHVHVDIGYVDEKYVHRRNVWDTTHLMLDKYGAPEFVSFTKMRRGLTKETPEIKEKRERIALKKKAQEQYPSWCPRHGYNFQQPGNVNGELDYRPNKEAEELKRKMPLKDKKVCDWEGCTNAPGSTHFIHGRPYCPGHYSPALEKHFFKELDRWDRKSEPSEKFRNLFGRYSDAFYKEAVSGGLTKAMLERLNVKGVNFVLERMRKYRERSDCICNIRADGRVQSEEELLLEDGSERKENSQL